MDARCPDCGGTGLFPDGFVPEHPAPCLGRLAGVMIRGFLSHVDLTVTDLRRSVDFYDRVLGAARLSPHGRRRRGRALLGNCRLRWRSFHDRPEAGSCREQRRPHDRYAPGLHHLAFHADSRAEVDGFHAFLVGSARRFSIRRPSTATRQDTTRSSLPIRTASSSRSCSSRSCAAALTNEAPASASACGRGRAGCRTRAARSGRTPVGAGPASSFGHGRYERRRRCGRELARRPPATFRPGLRRDTRVPDRNGGEAA